MTHDFSIAEMTLKAETDDHLIAPTETAPDSARRRFILILAACLIAHALLVAFLIYENRNAERLAQPEEIPVELVQQIPEPQVEPPPPPPKEKQPQPKQKVADDEKPAFDAPREANKETIEREASEQHTQAQRQAAPTEQNAQTPAPPKPPEATANADVQAPQEDAPVKPADENPNAEPLDKAEAAPEKQPTEKKAPVLSKAPTTKAKQTTIADQLASLAPTPDYHLGSAARPSPVGGGTAKTTYLSILFGLIMRQFHFPPGLQESHQQIEGIVAFYVDERGNLTHQAIYRASGRPDLDQAAMIAVRRAAPFPPPPPGDPHAIWFHFDTR
ncbi:MAG: TonB family protein [Methylocella sp.]